MTERFGERVSALEKLLAAATPGPWRFELGGGHAYNRIVGSESVQTNGWPERRNGFSNASYTDRVCENLGDTNLPSPAANAELIAAAPEAIRALLTALREQQRALVQCEAVLSKIDTLRHLCPEFPALDAARATLQKWRIDE